MSCLRVFGDQLLLGRVNWFQIVTRLVTRPDAELIDTDMGGVTSELHLLSCVSPHVLFLSTLCFSMPRCSCPALYFPTLRSSLFSHAFFLSFRRPHFISLFSTLSFSLLHSYFSLFLASDFLPFCLSLLLSLMCFVSILSHVCANKSSVHLSFSLFIPLSHSLFVCPLLLSSSLVSFFSFLFFFFDLDDKSILNCLGLVSLTLLYKV